MAQASVSVRGTPENPIFDFVLPDGPKGEPGGWTAPVNVFSTTDANSLVTPGVYFQSSGSTLTLNWPIAAKGLLYVYGLAGSLHQEFTVFSALASTASKVRYMRDQLTATTWSAWQAYTAQRVDNTAGRAIYTWDDAANREQLIFGDTGWRGIESMLFADNFAPTADGTGKARIRRVGNQVHLVLRLKPSDVLAAKNSPKNSTSVVLIDIPAGFRETPSTYGLAFTGTVQVGSSLEVIGIGAVNSVGQLKVAGTSTTPWRAGEIISASLTWPCEGAWPTELPGTV